MQDKLEQLMKRLDGNLADFRVQWTAMSQNDLIERSHEISAVKDTHYYLTETHGFDADEIDYLLLFDNPLQVVADKWMDRTEDLSDFSFALDEVFDKRDALRDYALKDEDKLEQLHSGAVRSTASVNRSKEQEVR